MQEKPEHATGRPYDYASPLQVNVLHGRRDHGMDAVAYLR
jgi:hypothetical protein